MVAKMLPTRRPLARRSRSGPGKSSAGLTGPRMASTMTRRQAVSTTMLARSKTPASRVCRGGAGLTAIAVLHFRCACAHDVRWVGGVRTVRSGDGLRGERGHRSETFLDTADIQLMPL